MSTAENTSTEEEPLSLSTTPETYPQFVVGMLSTEDDEIDSYKLHQSHIEINSDILHLLNLLEERISKLELQVHVLLQQKEK